MMNSDTAQVGWILFLFGFMASCIDWKSSRAVASRAIPSPFVEARRFLPIAAGAVGSTLWVAGAILVSIGGAEPLLGATLIGGLVASLAVRLRQRQAEDGLPPGVRFLSGSMMTALVVASILIGSYFAVMVAQPGAASDRAGALLAGCGAITAVWAAATGEEVYFRRRLNDPSITRRQVFEGIRLRSAIIASGAMVTIGLLLLLY